MNWSSALAGLDPLTVVTVTSTAPAVPGGEAAVICVSESTVNDVAAVEPKCTAVAPVNPEPVSVTVVPPAVGPADGVTPVTSPSATYVNSPPPSGRLCP